MRFYGKVTALCDCKVTVFWPFNGGFMRALLLTFTLNMFFLVSCPYCFSQFGEISSLKQQKCIVLIGAVFHLPMMNTIRPQLLVPRQLPTLNLVIPIPFIYQNEVQILISCNIGYLWGYKIAFFNCTSYCWFGRICC